MSRSPELYRWRTQIARHFPSLSRPLAMGLALWSLGMILVRPCSLTAIADWWSAQGGQPRTTVRERLRDTYRAASAKAGGHRQQPDVATCWGPWLNWVLEGRVGTRLAVAPDATTLGARLVILTGGVVCRGCAVPILWKILRAGVKHPWKPEWEVLSKALRGRAPATWTAIVLADRGLHAKWLFEAIAHLGWHPMPRVHLGGSFRPEGRYHWRPFRQLVPAVGRHWAGRGTAFTRPKTRLPCTPFACWEAGHADPRLLLTDLPPRAADACWYGLRARIEQRFKKSNGGLAVAIHPHDRSRPGRTAAVGDRHRDPVAIGRRRGGGSRDPDRHLPHGAGLTPPPRSPLAVGGHFPARLVVDLGRALQSSAVTHRPRLPGTLAGRTTHPHG